MTYDIAIIGGGCAGLGCAIYAKRFGMSVAVFSDLLGGLITKTHLVENYPGFASLSGYELAQNIINHAKGLDAEFINTRIDNIEKKSDTEFVVTTQKGETYTAKTVCIATGTKHKTLGIPGEQEFTNKGVSYCATCDGPFFKGKTVAMVGGSDSAVKESLLLAEHCEKVYIVYRKPEITKAEPINIKRMNEKDNIEQVLSANVVEVLGSETVEKIKLDTGAELDVQGLFIAIGGNPQTDLAKNLGVELNEIGEIKINRESQTNVPGVFGAGDCCDTPWKQAIVGVAEGTFAAYSAFNHMKAQEH